MTAFQSFVLNHSFDEYLEVHDIYMQLGPKPADSTQADELFHAAVIAWENPLGGQVEIEPETNTELRQMME